MKRIIALSNVNYAVNGAFLIKKANKNILNNINLELFENSITGLIGESGCGKTTLAKIISKIYAPTSGSIEAAEKLNIQLLFQNSEESIHPFRKVISILNDVSAVKSDIINICNLLGIEEKLLEQKGISLSGGERQRAALARILLKKPGLIILDEPFSAQDPASQIKLASLFKAINLKYNCSLLIISHNIEPIKNLTKNIIVMHKGNIVESGATDEVLNMPFHPYTKFLIQAEAYNLRREDFSEDEEITGFACAFYNRCKNKTDVCKKEVTIRNEGGRMAYCNNL